MISPLAGAEFILVGEVENAVHIDTLVLYLLHYKILRLYAVHPIRQCGNGIMGGLSVVALTVSTPSFRQVKEPAVLIGGNDPVRNPVIIQLKGIVCKTFKESAAKEAHGGSSRPNR